MRRLRNLSRKGTPSGVSRTACVFVLSLASLVVAFGAPATASATSPWWHLSPRMFPSNLPPGGEATVVLTAVNLGDAQEHGVPKLTESFPAGYTVQGVELFALWVEQGKINLANVPQSSEEPAPFCEHGSESATCHVNLETLAKFGYNKSCETCPGEPVVNPYEDIEMRVTVKNEAAPGGEAAMHGEVTGGEAPTATTTQLLPTSGAAPSFGVEHFSMEPEEEGGDLSVQAGAHPFQFTSTLTLREGPDQTKPLAMPKEFAIKLPPGLVGNASRTPQCTDADLIAQGEEHGGVGIATTVNRCPANTMIGAASLTFDEPNLGGVVTNSVPIFNLAPEPGEPARFGFEVVQAPVILDTAVRTGGDYGVTVSVHDVTQLVAFISSTVTFWGVPGDERHDPARGWPCFITGKWYSAVSGPACVHERQTHPTAFLSLPTACGPFGASVQGVSWPTPSAPSGVSSGVAEYSLADQFGRELGITGCGTLRFEPSIEVSPDVTHPNSPTGLRVDLHMPEEADEAPNGTANSAIKDLTVTLPAGVTVNPASAGGLEACSESQVGYLSGESTPPSELRFAGTLSQGWEAGVGFCPTASKIGTAKITSRLLPTGQTVEGGVYLAAQNANPFGSLLALYIVAEDPISKVAVKLAGEVQPDPVTGRLTTTFRNMPQLPFEDAVLKFFDGPRAALTTPATCGNYTTVASASPWSGGSSAEPSSTFSVSSPCPSQRSFAPRVAVAPQSLQAAGFSSIVTSLSNEDGAQSLQGVTLQLPAGVSAVLKGVPLCAEADANAGSCPAASLIGSASALAGVGPEPFEVTGGRVYLTESYRGAPFGLSIVTPAKAGPFDLGNVIVRAQLQVDRHTGQAIVVTDSTGPHSIPEILDGIPLSLRQVKVAIDRAGFTFNPTNCSSLEATGTATSHEGASVPLASSYRVANCATLGFAPKFSVSTSGKTSRALGTSLSVKLSYPKAPFGSQANIARVKVTLPKQLPSRIETLHQACIAAVFNEDPAKCPTHSVVGSARVTTPLLPVPLTGRAYFVSHGGAQFPDLTMVLTGYGIRIDLVGSTFIKNGITTTTFASVPDVPFETFELTLPKDRYSALGAFGNLCKEKLVMPTEFQAQNGKLLRRNTPVRVTACGNVKKKKKKKHSVRRSVVRRLR